MYAKKRSDSLNITDEELKLLFEAIGDFVNKGTTTTKCPRCGGELAYKERGSSAVIKCKKEGCLKISLRGI